MQKHNTPKALPEILLALLGALIKEYADKPSQWVIDSVIILVVVWIMILLTMHFFGSSGGNDGTRK